MRNIVYIVLGGVIFLFIITFYRLTKNIKKFSLEKELYTTEIVNSQQKIEQLTSCISLMLKYNNVPFQDSIWLYDKNNTPIRIREAIVPTLRKMVCYVSKDACQSCNADILLKTKTMINKIGKQNLLIIVPYSRYREFYLFFQENNIDIDFYGIKDNGLGYSVFENYPLSLFYFILDFDLNCHHVFLVDKNYSKNADNYIDIISNLYFI